MVLGARDAFMQTRTACRIMLSERRGVASMRGIPLESGLGNSIALAIGPEGGWTDEEIAASKAEGFMETSLGNNILRTETAVIAALALLGFLAGRR